MKKTEQRFNFTIGLNFLLWAVLGLITESPGGAITVVRISISLLNLVVGLLFILRRDVATSGTWQDVCLCLPSFILCGLAFRATPPPDQWPVYAQTTFACGTLLAIISFLVLGRNFAVFPALRGITTAGPYAIVRHPAYLGESIMVLACVFAAPGMITILAMLLLLPFIALRIIVEEKLLESSEEYQIYRNVVGWRFAPGLW